MSVAITRSSARSTSLTLVIRDVGCLTRAMARSVCLEPLRNARASMTSGKPGKSRMTTSQGAC